MDSQKRGISIKAGGTVYTFILDQEIPGIFHTHVRIIIFRHIANFMSQTVIHHNKNSIQQASISVQMNTLPSQQKYTTLAENHEDRVKCVWSSKTTIGATEDPFYQDILLSLYRSISSGIWIQWNKIRVTTLTLLTYVKYFFRPIHVWNKELGSSCSPAHTEITKESLNKHFWQSRSLDRCHS